MVTNHNLLKLAFNKEVKFMDQSNIIGENSS